MHEQGAALMGVAEGVRAHTNVRAVVIRRTVRRRRSRVVQ